MEWLLTFLLIVASGLITLFAGYRAYRLFTR